MDDRHRRALIGERHPASSPAALRETEGYLTEQFNGGEELTGENAFGGPIQVTLPLGDSGPGLENRLALAESLSDLSHPRALEGLDPDLRPNIVNFEIQQ